MTQGEKQTSLPATEGTVLEVNGLMTYDTVL